MYNYIICTGDSYAKGNKLFAFEKNCYYYPETYSSSELAEQNAVRILYQQDESDTIFLIRTSGTYPKKFNIQHARALHKNIRIILKKMDTIL